jgi:cold shock CspA family protein
VIPPTPGLTEAERGGEERAWAGTVTNVNPEKKFGFLTADNNLPRDYKGNSLFFHCNVVKNSLGQPVKLEHGSKVKFVLYKAKDGDTDNLEKPKAFAVYVTNTQASATKKENTKEKRKKEGEKEKPKAKKEEGNVAQAMIKTLARTGTKPPMKVSIFWDIENCRPKRNTILEVVKLIRSLVLQGHQVTRVTPSTT